jgi:hypothetical protein
MRGIAVAEAFGTYVAQVAEVTVAPVAPIGPAIVQRLDDGSARNNKSGSGSRDGPGSSPLDIFDNLRSSRTALSSHTACAEEAFGMSGHAQGM